MNGQPSPVPPNRKTRCLEIVALIFVGLIALYFVYRHSLALSIQARIDAIHHAGFPATCAELDKWYQQPPAGENAADVYSNAFAYYQLWTNKDAQFSAPADVTDTNKYFSPPKSKRDLLPIVGMAKLPKTEPLSAEAQKVIAEYLSDNAESLRLLHEAASMKSCRYPVDLAKGVMMSLRHLNSIRNAERLLALAVVQSTGEKQAEQAVEAAVDALAIARSLNQEPVFISYLVGAACRGIALENVKRIVNTTFLTDSQLMKLASALQESRNQSALTRAMVGDRCIDGDIFQDLRSGKTSLGEMYSLASEDQGWPLFLIATYKVSGLLELDHRSYLDAMERFVKAAQLASPQSIDGAQAVDRGIKQLPRRRILSRLFMPSLSLVFVQTSRSEAQFYNEQTALAVERYRLANSKLPSQLSDLVPTFLPSVPSDPFDGKPLRYKTLAKGYVVYSVGDDREDNGGTEKNSKGISYVPGTDITFAVER